MTVIKKKIGGGSVRYVKYSEAKPGDVLAIGNFIGTELVKAYDPKQPDVPQHTILDEEGTSLKLNSAGQLNFLLKSVEAGTLIEVEANQFEVSELVEE
jgi:hypothetical protein